MSKFVIGENVRVFGPQNISSSAFRAGWSERYMRPLVGKLGVIVQIIDHEHICNVEFAPGGGLSWWWDMEYVESVENASDIEDSDFENIFEKG